MNFSRIKVASIVGVSVSKISIPEKPGVYRWWFPESLAVSLLSSLSGVDSDCIQKEKIDDQNYWCLYFGISRNLRERICWHVNQHHTKSAVKSGFLSTLRQTLSALLKTKASVSEDAVDSILKQCYWDYCEYAAISDAQNDETNELLANYYPINLRGNKAVSKETIASLKGLRKKFSKI